MPETIQDEPLHPALAEHDANREAFLSEANEIFQARAAQLNPLAEKISQATRPPSEQETPKTDATSPRSQAQPKADASTSNVPTTPNVAASSSGKIAGPPNAVADKEWAADSSALQPQSPSLPEHDADIPGPDDYQGGKGFTSNWKKLHAAKDAYKQEVKKLQQQLEQVQRNGVNGKQNGQPDQAEFAKQLQAIQAERDNLMARLEAVAVEKSPRFEAAFKPRVDAALAQARNAVGPDRSKRVEEILALPEGNYRDEQLEAIAGEIDNTFRRNKLVSAVAELDRVSEERRSLASRGSELYKQWQTEEQQNIQRKHQEDTQRALGTFDSEAQAWKHIITPDDETMARNVFIGNADLSDAARASLWAVAGPKLAKQSMEKDQRIKELESELAKFRSVQPGTGNAGGTPQASDDMPTDIGYGEAISRIAQQAGLLRR